MIDVYELLKKLEQRPVMYTGVIGLKAIRTYIEGYWMCLHEHQLEKNNEDYVINFHDWIAHKLGFRESTAGWSNMIIAVSMGLVPNQFSWEDYDKNITDIEHELSVKKFYTLIDEYIIEGKNKHNNLS